MLSNEFLKGFSRAVQAYGMNKPRRVAYDAKPARFTPRTRASDQLNEEELTNNAGDNRPLPDELMDLLRRQLDPDTYQMLCEALNGSAGDQDPDEEDKPAAGLSGDLIEKICEMVGPHLSDDDFEQFKQLLDGMSPKSAEDEPPPFSGRPTAGGSQDPITPASRAPSVKSPAKDAMRIKSLTPGGQLAYDMGSPFTGERNGVSYYQGVRLNGRPRKVSTSSAQSYAKRFPNAARLRNV